MPAHIIFVRFFHYQTQSSLFEREVHLKDNAFVALNAFCMSDRAGPDCSEKWPAALFHPVETDAFKKLTCGAFFEGFSYFLPVKRFSTKEDADVAAAALQQSASKLGRSIDAKPSWNSADLFLATANPRFFVISENELSGSEAELARERILSNPPAKYETREEIAIRFLMGMAAELESGSPPLAVPEHLSRTLNDIEFSQVPDEDGPYRGELEGLLEEGSSVAALEAPEAQTKKEKPRARLENEARDKWIYKRYLKGTALAKIKGDLKQKSSWRRISSDQGIRQAAIRYADRHNLARPPSRHGK